ncbi:MAG TPA: response regulator transcription factor [Chitinophagaceae bacterium]|nr:response regulator transcription factor [Chitinophagaceae bacterium]
MTKRFLLVDDHSIVRSGVKLIITDKYLDAKVDEAADGEAAFNLVKKNEYDLMVIDLHMPSTDTMGLIVNILNMRPSAKIMVFTMGSEDVFAKRYLKLGVKGFLNKDCEDQEVSRAIEMILSNRKYVSERLINRLTEDSIKNRPDNPFQLLSNRELEITMLLIGGKAIGEITEILNIQNSTVGTHKAHILEKLKVENVIDLSELAKLYEII